MSARSAGRDVVRFGVFEADLQTGELRKSGVRLSLEPKPLQILELLLARPGEIVSRKDIQQRLWPDTHVLFDYGLNTAMNKLRLALGDTAGNPRFIETLPRRGYRFLAGVVAVSSRTAAGSAISSIAVLPLRNPTRRPATEYLSDGLSEAVIRSLSKIQGVRVVAWSTVLRYKGREADPQMAGRELPVQSVLAGRAAFGKNSVDASLELVDSATGWRLWGQEYHRRSDELPALAEEIASEIGAKLRPEDAEERSIRPEKLRRQDSEAYRDYLKGRFHWYKLSREDLEKSLWYFQRAIEKDPRFALAHAALADAYVLFAFVSLLPSREALQQARAAALRALELEADLAEAHASCASVTKLCDWDWPKAEREYRKSLQLDPNNAIARRGYADFLSALGRTEEAMAEIRQAQELDPTSLVIGTEVAWNLYMAREYEQARLQAIQTIGLEPEFSSAHNVLGLALEQLGKYEEAIAELQRSAGHGGAHETALASLAHAHACCGETGRTRAILKKLEREARKRYVAPYSFALIHAGLCEKEKAIERLAEAYEIRDVWMIWVNRDPRFDTLRDEPSFRRLLLSMKFPGAERRRE